MMPTRDLTGWYDPTSTPASLTTDKDACWGQALTGCAEGCTAGFQPGTGHFKTKFCRACQNSLRVPVERVRALTGTELDGSVNRRSEGFWNTEASGILRVVNNTANCVEPALAIYRDELPAEVRAGWSPLPAHWVDSDGCVRFCVAKGTLVPAASLRSGQLYGPRQKRQRLDPRAVFAPDARSSEPFAASPVDMTISLQQLEHEVTDALGVVAPPACAPPAQRAAAPPCCAPPSPGRGAAHSIEWPPAFVPPAQGAAPPPKAAVCAAALAAAAKDVAPFPPAARHAVAAPFPAPLSAAQQAPQPETLLPEELAPALSSALKEVGALLGAALDQAELSAPQQRFLQWQRRQFEESSHALHHFWQRPSELEEHAMQVEAQLGLHCAAGGVPGAPEPTVDSGADDDSVATCRTCAAALHVL